MCLSLNIAPSLSQIIDDVSVPNNEDYFLPDVEAFMQDLEEEATSLNEEQHTVCLPVYNLFEVCAVEEEQYQTPDGR